MDFLPGLFGPLLLPGLCFTVYIGEPSEILPCRYTRLRTCGLGMHATLFIAF